MAYYIDDITNVNKSESEVLETTNDAFVDARLVQVIRSLIDKGE